MDAVRIGVNIRALRVRSRLRQSDLAAKAGVPREVISEIERGILSRASIEELERIAVVLGAQVDVRVRWRGEQLDRLLDQAHAATVAAALDRLGRTGWDTRVEASFSIWGERGSIDILAWHAATSTLLVIEVKSVIPDVQATIHDLDRKARLAPEVTAQFGWHPIAIARLLIVAESPTSRGRVRRHAVVLDTALPVRGGALRVWLRRPVGPIRGLMFLSNAAHSHTTGGIWRRERVRAPRHRVAPGSAAIDKESTVPAGAPGASGS
jgi:transcriptional regulator with XRE-family HTH domain